MQLISQWLTGGTGWQGVRCGIRVFGNERGFEFFHGDLVVGFLEEELQLVELRSLSGDEDGRDLSPFELRHGVQVPACLVLMIGKVSGFRRPYPVPPEGSSGGVGIN